MNKSNFEKVCEFQQAVAQKIGIPTGKALMNLRARLIVEEYKEVMNELGNGTHIDFDRAALAKELADLLYVVYGTAEAYNIPIDAVFDAVHTSNMQKVTAGIVVDGKLQKPANYVAPDIEAILFAQHA